MASNKIESLEIEPLSNEKSPGNESAENPPFNPLLFFVNLCNLIVAYAEYYRNITAGILACLTVLTVIVSLEFIAKASTKSHNAISSMKHDFTNSHSFFDLVMKDVDHWCLAVCCLKLISVVRLVLLLIQLSFLNY